MLPCQHWAAFTVWKGTCEVLKGVAVANPMQFLCCTSTPMCMYGFMYVKQPAAASFDVLLHTIVCMQVQVVAATGHNLSLTGVHVQSMLRCQA